MHQYFTSATTFCKNNLNLTLLKYQYILKKKALYKMTLRFFLMFSMSRGIRIVLKLFSDNAFEVKADKKGDH